MAALGAGGRVTGAKGALVALLSQPFGFASLGVVAFGLALFAVSVMLGLKAARGTDEQSARDWTAYALGVPLGRWLVGAVGLGIAAAGIGTAINGLRASFEKELPGQARRWVVLLGRCGFMARGVVFVIVGLFLIHAGVDANPREARGLGGALRMLEAQPFRTCAFRDHRAWPFRLRHLSMHYGLLPAHRLLSHRAVGRQAPADLSLNAAASGEPVLRTRFSLDSARAGRPGHT